MKNLSKLAITLIIGIALIVVGAIVFLSSFPFGSDPTEAFSEKSLTIVDYNESISSEGVTDIKINVFFKTKVYNVEGNEVQVKATGKIFSTFGKASKTDISVTNVENKINISVGKPDGFTLFYLPFVETEIGIPKNYKGNLELNTVTGETVIDVTNTFNNVDVTTTTGYTSIQNFACNKLNTKLTTGKMTIKNIKCNGMQSNATTGSLEIHFNELCKADIKLTTGDLAIYLPENEQNVRLDFSRTTGKLMNYYFDGYGTKYKNDMSFIKGDSSLAKHLTVKVTTGDTTLRKIA